MVQKKQDSKSYAMAPKKVGGPAVGTLLASQTGV